MERSVSCPFGRATGSSEAPGKPSFSVTFAATQKPTATPVPTTTPTPTNVVVTLDSTGSVGYSTSILLDSSGSPVIACHDAGSDVLKLIHCGNANCFSGNTRTTPNTDKETADQYGRYLALDASGFPVISYQDESNLDLKVVHCADVNCAAIPMP